MPFPEKSKLSLKKEFIAQIANGELSMSELCMRFEISRPTGYKWARRFVDEGTGGLDEKSRKPHESPARTRVEVEQAVLEVRDEVLEGACDLGWELDDLITYLIAELAKVEETLGLGTPK